MEPEEKESKYKKKSYIIAGSDIQERGHATPIPK